MERRRFLRAGGLAGLGLALGGCAYGSPRVGNPRVRPADLAPVRVSFDRIIRTVVGLRPFRASGFRLETERLDDKTVVHNYGHGGSGMSLSWGTARLAAELALAHTERQAAVIGCGIMGLTSARELQRRGFEVSVYAKELPPNTTSNKLFGGFTPISTLVERRSPDWDAQFRRAVEIAYREHQLLVGRGYGIRWIDAYERTNDPDEGEGPGNEGYDDPNPDRPLMERTYALGSVLLGPGEHPFSSTYARRAPILQFDPDVYLEALMRDVIAFGGRISARTFGSPADLVALSEPVIVNCTGLGAAELFGDDELTPVKGQLTILVPQPEVDYAVGAMVPRGSGIVLGHVRQFGVSDLSIDREEERRVMENAARIFDGMRPPRSRFAPSRRGRRPIFS